MSLFFDGAYGLEDLLHSAHLGVQPVDVAGPHVDPHVEHQPRSTSQALVDTLLDGIQTFIQRALQHYWQNTNTFLKKIK